MRMNSSTIKKVLVTSAGCGPAVSVIKELKRQKDFPLHIYSSDIDETAPGLHLSDKYFLSPPMLEENYFVEFMYSLCKKNKIDFILPSLDKEILILSDEFNKSIIEKSGAKLLCNPHDISIRCIDKIESIQHCVNNEILVPGTHSGLIKEDGRTIHESVDWMPIIIKPRMGSGAKENIIIRNKIEKKQAVLNKGFFYQEFIDGKEYTIDILCDTNAQFLAALPRERMLVKSGQTVKGRVCKTSRLIKYAKNIASLFELTGVSCLQCIEKNNKLYFIELNPRYGTGISLAVGAGINMPLLHIKMAMGISPTKKELEYKDKLIMTRHWEERFIYA
ncbi:hypothetical protein CL622_05330 [archaeon]|nr:hypothetical protein [archaeon]